jgi:probable rRNA maturation factor
MQKVKQIQTSIFNIDLSVNDNIWDTKLKSLENKIPTIVDLIMNKLDLITHSNIELSIILTNDNEIQKLNLEYLGKNKPTNVLSFPAHNFDANKISSSLNENILSLGDIVISYDTLEKERIKQNISFVDHFVHLLIHSFLHLLGFDHMTEKEAEEMEKLEIAILAEFGIQSPYAT